MPVQEVRLSYSSRHGHCADYGTKYGTLQFSKFEEIQKAGYHAALEILKKWNDEGRLPPALIDGHDNIAGKKKGRSARRNSI